MTTFAEGVAGTPLRHLIDSGVAMPEPDYIERNRQAARFLDGRAAGTSFKFDERRYRAERGGYKRFPPGYSKRGEKPAAETGPLPLFMQKHHIRHSGYNCQAPASDMKSHNAAWFEQDAARKRAEELALREDLARQAAEDSDYFDERHFMD